MLIDSFCVVLVVSCIFLLFCTSFVYSVYDIIIYYNLTLSAKLHLPANCRTMTLTVRCNFIARMLFSEVSEVSLYFVASPSVL